ncbi:hypothetical protein [Gloeocapsopsis sp. IPPAS B-1203]|uniref:hypothetical protein n=1 Tax=Gloeocapsopsis sp. IPPAS B-1203 TaxID=2049454 RepID=UPI00117C7373|nr:hypothetical protein [Gloeocapsopsis sp. IPPAS B-1203]
MLLDTPDCRPRGDALLNLTGTVSGVEFSATGAWRDCSAVRSATELAYFYPTAPAKPPESLCPEALPANPRRSH